MARPPSVRSDIIVGIDFGMTCTGVAYSYGPSWPSPKTIQRWPGKLGHELRNKVETSVAYTLGNAVPATWGFLCNPDDEAFEYNSLFKLYLDPTHRDPTPDPPSNADARRWYRDYMAYLYDYLMRYFSNTFPRFEGKSIDFVFSVPVTWRSNPTLISDIEALTYAAGFGSRPQDTISVSLTEAEAAAIYASRGSLSRDDVFLVCDAGGGTMDLNTLKVTSAAQGNIELFPLSWTEGASIGSTLIDFRIRSMIKLRLAAVQDHLEQDIADITTKMMAERFETFKCSFGSPALEVSKLVLPIPGLKAGVDMPEQGIEDSKIIITRAELQQVFDDQVDRMCILIDRQLALIRERHHQESVDYLVLSGGLGSSPYIQACIRARYESGPGHQFTGRRSTRVLVSDEPQLAVAHGLVIARMQANTGSHDIMTKRCCPVSFGILSREPYDPTRHQGEKIVEDPYDKRRWAEGQINWVLRQGQVVHTDYGVSERYSTKIPMGREFEPWTTTIVMSTLPADQLPKSMKYRGARVICAVEAILDQRDMKRKNRHWYNLRHEYNHAEFLVRMIVGTGLRFEIWSMDGTIRSRSHEEIAVQWMNIDPAQNPEGPEGSAWQMNQMAVELGRSTTKRQPQDVKLGVFEASARPPVTPELDGFGVLHELPTSPLAG